jgi:Growth inhibitor
MERTIKRGEIYYAKLSPVIGSEQGGTRPVLIISNDMGNKHSPTVIVATITSKQTKSKIPTHCYLTGIEELPADSIILLEQIRTLDKKRLGNRITKLNDPYMKAIEKPLLISIGISAERRGL